jgi:hypothetical protein
MPSIYGGGSGGKSIYGGGGGGSAYVTAPRKKKDKGKSVGGFLGKLGGDIAEAAIGLGPGLYSAGKAAGSDVYGDFRHPGRIVGAVKDPIGTVSRRETYKDVLRPVGQSYKQTYGPAVRGEWGKFLDNLYEDPLGPILDVATVGLGGAGAAGRISGSASKLERLEYRSARAIAEGKGPTAKGKVLSRNLLTRAGQKGIHKGLNRLDPETRVVGELARYGRAVGKDAKRAQLGKRLKSVPYSRAWGKLKTEERVVLNLFRRGLRPEEAIALARREGKEPGVEGALRNPKVQKAYEQPSKRLQRAYEEGKKLSETLTEMRVAGGLKKDSAVERPWLHARLASGADFDGDILVGGKSIDELREQFKQEGRPEPFYAPDKMVQESAPSFARTGGGVGVPKAPGTLKQNRGVLAKTGQLALDPDSLGPEFLRQVKFEHFSDIHDELIGGARRIPAGAGLPQGYQYLRRSTRERISHTEKNVGEFRRDLEELIPDPEDVGESVLSEGFVTRHVDDAATDEQGFRLAIPESVARRAAGEFTKANRAIKYVLDKPTVVWRAIVLGYRPGFLVNNVVGNNLLYAIRQAGAEGMVSYLHAVQTAKGPAAVGRLLRDPKTRNKIDQDFMAQYFPEQVQGTFGQTQRARFQNPRLERASRAAGTGIIPATQAVSEGMLRRAAVEAELRRSPEVRSAYRELRKKGPEKASFREASEKALAENEPLRDFVSQRVNDTLGDYLSLSAAERGAIRSLAPFYAWYRAIAKITVKLPRDMPARTAVFARLGQIGSEDTKRILGELPSYLRGAIPIGSSDGDAQTILRTQGLNPFVTPIKTAEGLSIALPSSIRSSRAKRELLGMLNVYIVEAAYSLATGALPPWLREQAELYESRDLPLGDQGFIVNVGQRVGSETPPARLARGSRPSKLYPERDRGDDLVNFLGLPTGRLSKREARKRARRGD